MSLAHSILFPPPAMASAELRRTDSMRPNLQLVAWHNRDGSCLLAWQQSLVEPCEDLGVPRM